MTRIKVYDGSVTPVCVNSGWIVISIIFMLLSFVMALIALRNAQLLDCIHTYAYQDKMYCTSEMDDR